MNVQGVDLTGEPDEISTTICWQEPHMCFVIILVGPEEQPFGIQKDLLCAQSPYYRDEFTNNPDLQGVELVVKLPEFDVQIFCCFQCFIYTGELYDKRFRKEIPPYSLLLGVWRLAAKFKMAPLRMQILNTMFERRMTTGSIPGPELLIEAWKQTDEGSALRKMLINWTAENMRDVPEFRPRLAKTLPQEILGELVIILSDPASIPVFPTAAQPQPARHQHPVVNGVVDVTAEEVSTVHKPFKRPRKSEPTLGIMNGDDNIEIKPVIKKVRKSEPGAARKINRRVSTAHGYAAVDNAMSLTPEKEIEFCKDLIHRMLSGPGFWTRLVGPFKKPVDPSADQVPNYFAVVKKPMDLTTIRNKMNHGVYTSAAAFEADVRQIFQNCYEYWTQDDNIFKLCEQFEKYFNEKWATRHKWQPSVKQEVLE